ncbi:hypothetical protein BOX17_10715 [Halomonas aestuarii]|uniref:Uncharacterized protein n=1 Tax=Halomonas aestuarii TaxID=1897729 RepID=A0A1J0VH75_9GAMM|nr:hypothetical protein [Halomonas aestuarii]APE31377.1 hypothetical protein BOX17_10715 [Halomonas aestuarii]
MVMSCLGGIVGWVMTQISTREFLGYVEEWVNGSYQKIGSMWPQKGGWEKWAQSEIGSFILSQDSTCDLLREQGVYVSKRKDADFLLNGMSMTASDKVVVELKCQSFENYKNFKKGLEEDISKLSRELKPGFSGADLLVLGIYFFQHSDIPPYFDKKVLDNGEVGMCWAIDLNS